LGKKVVPFKIDPEYEAALREMAQRRGIPVSELIRRIVVNYIDSNTSEETAAGGEALPSSVSDEVARLLRDLEEMISSFEKMVDEEEKKIQKYCEEHADQVVLLHPAESRDYHLKWCLKRYYGLLYNKALDHKRSYIMPLISRIASKSKINMSKYEKRVDDVLDRLLPITEIRLE
jgi:hypothetical protein